MKLETTQASPNNLSQLGTSKDERTDWHDEADINLKLLLL
jgi:hypothetical protein